MKLSSQTVIYSSILGAVLESEHIAWRDDDEYFAVYQSGSVRLLNSCGDELSSIPTGGNQISTISIAPAREDDHEVTAFVFLPCTGDVPVGILKSVRFSLTMRTASYGSRDLEWMWVRIGSHVNVWIQGWGKASARQTSRLVSARHLSSYP